MTSPAQPVPKGWQTFSFGDLLKFSNGINAGKSAYGSGVPFANVLEVITNESLEADGIPGRVSLPRRVLARYEVRRGDILFNRTSETQDEVGLACVYLGHEPIVFGGFVLRGRLLTGHLDLGYSKYALRTAGVRDQIIARGQGGIRANVGQRDLKGVTVTLPPPPEQQVIAEALDDISGQIKVLERFIAKKQAIKQGMMQQLLTGATRLAGFVEKWREAPLAEVSVMKGRIGWQGLTQEEFTSNAGQPFLITGMNFKDGAIRWNEVYHVSEDRYAIAPEIQLRPGDVLMTKDGTIGKLLYVDSIPYPGKATLNSHLLVFRPKGSAYIPRFLYYQLASPRFGEHIELYKSGTTFFGIGQGAVGRYKMLLPSIEEQTAIAAVLSDADSQMTMIETRLNKARAIKQGLMQQLLSGRTRLPVRRAAA